MYSEQDVIESLQGFARDAGHPPSWEEWKAWGLRPSGSVMARLFGGWSNAMCAAGLPALPRGGEDRAKYEETARIAGRIDCGERQSVIARELGISCQALGRRVGRWRAMVERDGEML